MEKKETNGNEPANAVMHADGTFTGLTKREHLVAMAMQGLLANSNLIDSQNEATLSWVSKASLKFADSLIEALNKTPNQP